jgi:uncharacterized repeat protein (TIGR01451 family)
MPRPRHLLVLLAAAGGLLPAGCFQAYNPSYFPNWGFMGPIDRTHAKPSGGAYFKNYDPKACRIELTPLKCDNPTGTQQVLIASVVDADGMPRRSRRIEWLIDGPGYIVEVDESGWYSGRGYKVDNKYAVSFTDYKEHTFTRGSDNPRDNFTIKPGQSWCVVSSAVEGQTTVTAYAPEVFIWENGRTTATLTWGPALPGFGPGAGGGGGIQFPPPTVSRAGGDVALTTSFTRGKNGDPAPDGLKVRYRVIDGPPAVLLARGSAPTDGSTVLYGAGRAETEVAADASGKAAVTVRESAIKPGTTRIAIDVVRADPDNRGKDVVVKSSETRVEWAAADVTLNLSAPRVAALNGEVPLTVLLANAGKADSQPVTVRAVVPDGAEFVAADPPPTKRQDRSLTWAADPLTGGQSRPIVLTVRPTRKGTMTLSATAETADGKQAEQKASIPVDAVGLAAVVESPPPAAVGDKVPLNVTVTNTGAVPLAGVTAFLTLDEGLIDDDGAKQPELSVGAIAPGQTKKATARVSATRSGRFAVRANVTADGGLSAKADGAAEFRRAELTAAVVGPTRVSVGDDVTWDVRVTNSGDAALSGVVVRASLPAGLTPVTAGRQPPPGADDGVELPVGNLAPGERKSVQLRATADALLGEGTVRVTAAAGDAKTSARATVSVVGRPALAVSIPDPPGSFPVGRRGPVKVTVRNTGDAPAKRLTLTVTGSKELTLYGGTSADKSAARADGDRVAFSPVEALPPGATAVFSVDVGATTPGPARLSAEATADGLDRPVRDEQSARVVP